ncbi:MAG: HEAT repeat protein [Candidatus Binatia bacterium]|jgi:HEAT repeat protein
MSEKMKPRRRWNYALISAAIICVAIALWPSGEPTYEGYTVTEWIRDFQKARVGNRIGGIDYQENKAMRELGQKAVPYIVKELKAEDSSLKRAISELLVNQSLISVPLTAGQRRLGAGDALEVVGRVDPKFAKDLIPLLDSADGRVQFCVARVLGESQIKEALPALIEMAASEAEHERCVAATGLGKFRREHSIVLPVLVNLLGASEFSVVTSAARGVIGMGPAGRFVIPDLTKALDSIELQPEVAVALKKIDPDYDFENRVIPLLVAGISKSGPQSDPYQYIRALGQLGASAESALPTLMKLSETEDPRLRFEVTKVIARIKRDIK